MGLISFLNPEKMLKPDEWLGERPTSKSVYTSLGRVVWASTLESLLMSLMNFMDTLMVSSMGDYAVAATGLTNQPRLLFFAFFFALNVGVTAVVSRRKGEENRKGARSCLAQCLTICVLAALILCSVAISVARPLIKFAGADVDTFEPAVEYFKIIMVGVGFQAFGMVINAAQRGTGNTKITMITNLIANVINVTLNYFLINGEWIFPKLGIRGAAIATLTGNIVGSIISLTTIMGKSKYLRIRLSDCFKFDKACLKSVYKVASSAALEQIFIRIGFFAYAKSVAGLGTQAMATHQICMSVINFSFSFGDGLGIGASALIGQSLGRRRGDMAKLYGKCTQRVGLFVCVLFFVLFIGCGGFIMQLFTDDPQIIALGKQILIITAFASQAQITHTIYVGCLRGAGDTRFIAVYSMICITILRPVLTYIMCYPLGWGLIGAWISLLIDQYLRMMFAAVRFKKGKWSKIEL